MPDINDQRALLRGLQDYKASLDKHFASLKQEHQQLEGRWRAFNAVAQGDSMKQFRSVWQRSQANLKDYQNQSDKIKPLLEERIQALEDFLRANGGL